MSLLFQARQNRQPQTPTRLARTPLTAGLAMALSGAQPSRDIASGRTATARNGVSSAATSSGIGFVAASNASVGTQFANSPMVTSDGAGTGDFTYLVLANPVASSTREFFICSASGNAEFYFGANQVVGLGSSSGAFCAQTNFGAASGAAGGGVDGKMHVFSYVRSGATGTLGLDGASMTPVPVSQAVMWQSNSSDYVGGYSSSGWGISKSVVLVLGFNRALSPSEVKAWADNMLQYSAPQFRQIYLAVLATAGGSSYSYTASGGLVFSGVAPVVRKIARAAAGGIAFAGVSVRRAVRVIVPAGGMQLSGNAGMLRRAARATVGGLALAGAATVSVQSLVVVAAGGMLLRGVATVLRTISRRAAGGINLSGAATVTSTDRTASVRLNLYTIMRADSINIAADLAASVNLTTAFGTAQVDLYTIMRNDPINITAPLGASINLTGNLL